MHQEVGGGNNDDGFSWFLEGEAMIKIQILAEGEKVADSFSKKDTTLIENAVVIRRLEEIKHELLDIEYDSEFESQEDLG